jgi:outer membrane protein
VRRLIIALLLAAVAAGPALAQSKDEALQRAFVEAMQQLRAGNLERAEQMLRAMLARSDSPRVKLELARVLYLEGKDAEAKALFKQVSMQSDTPWRVRDNIAPFVRSIEERSGYLKLGVTIVSDSNPRNLAAQEEFTIGGLRVTPTEAPQKMTGLRYSVRGWMPALGASRTGGYLTASYADYPGQELDRISADLGLLRPLSASGRVRGRAGVELGTLGGRRLYHFPYLGLDAVLKQTDTVRLAGELKLGKVRFADFDYLDATYLSASASASRPVSKTAAVSLGATLERSQAREDPYSYDGWQLGPGADLFFPGSLYMAGVRAALGGRRYEAVDPLFGERRADTTQRLELTLGNKRWRWRDSRVSLVASLERNRSNIGFYSYRKFNLSVVVE